MTLLEQMSMIWTRRPGLIFIDADCLFADDQPVVGACVAAAALAAMPGFKIVFLTYKDVVEFDTTLGLVSSVFGAQILMQVDTTPQQLLEGIGADPRNAVLYMGQQDIAAWRALNVHVLLNQPQSI